MGLHFLEGVGHVECGFSVGGFSLGHAEFFGDFEHVGIEGDDEECGGDGGPGAGVYGVFANHPAEVEVESFTGAAFCGV